MSSRRASRCKDSEAEGNLAGAKVRDKGKHLIRLCTRTPNSYLTLTVQAQKMFVERMNE